MPGYDEKYIKDKVKEFNGVVKTNFLGDEIPKENVHYTCMTCITIDSVLKMKKKDLQSTSLFRRMQIQNQKDKDDQIHKHCIKVRVRVRVRI